MIIIKSKTNYNPWGKTLLDLKEKYPDMKFLKSATRKSDGTVFKANQWIKLKNGDEHKIIAFDVYDYPLPIDQQEKPIAQYRNGKIVTTVWKTKYKRIKRAIYASCLYYVFHDLEEWKWLGRVTHLAQQYDTTHKL